MLKKIKSKLSMKFVRSNFIDVVDGRMVNDYIDCYGIKWMAQSKYGFRVQKTTKQINQ